MDSIIKCYHFGILMGMGEVGIHRVSSLCKPGWLQKISGKQEAKTKITYGKEESDMQCMVPGDINTNDL